MIQIVQWPNSGTVELLDIPEPQPVPGRVVVRNAFSAISPGTERSMVEFGKNSLLSKARARPDLVGRLLEKSRTEGLVTTIEAARRRLEEPTLLGYSCAGTVIAVGEGVSHVRVGDRVACGGTGWATHADRVSVPHRLVALVPESVTLQDAAYAAIATIPLHAFRLAGAGLSQIVAVVGLGLVGQIATQVAIAAGCRVFAFDPREDRCRVARGTSGVTAISRAETVQSLVRSISHGIGVDAVLICASTESSEPIQMAADIAKDRAVIVMVGATGMNLSRRPFFQKELTFLVSRSYGPGRYDTDYEERGHDYPVGFVRWTEGRNLSAVLALMESRQLQLADLTSQLVTPDDAVALYATPEKLATELGILVSYDTCASDPVTPVTRQSHVHQLTPRDPLALGVVGAGQFARTVLLPAIQRAGGFRLVAVASAGGASAAAAKRQFGFERASASFDELLNDPAIGTVVIATRHNLHASQVIAALDAGKNVFVEKPLAITEVELDEVRQKVDQHGAGRLFVGYNRRFSRLVGHLWTMFQDLREPGILTYRINAGRIPADHWVHQSTEGGGRIVGEVCHFVDLLIHLTGELPGSVFARASPDNGTYSTDNVVITIGFEGGSVGAICYTAAGARAAGKERLEVFRSGWYAELDDYRRLRLTMNGRAQEWRSRFRQDKGYLGEWLATREALTGGAVTIPTEQLLAGARCTFRVLDSLRTGANLSVR